MLFSSYTEDDLVEAGCDEVGRGSLAGPVVAAAVIFPKKYKHPKINDSKKLSATQREKLEVEIKQAALCWAIAEASSAEIDMWNIAKASSVAIHRAIDQLTICPQLILVDGNFFYPHSRIPYRCIVRGDSIYLSIAAASILAKNYRDKLMHQWALSYAGYGWETNVGYPTLWHRQAIKNQGVTPIHRKSFTLLKKS